MAPTVGIRVPPGTCSSFPICNPILDDTAEICPLHPTPPEQKTDFDCAIQNLISNPSHIYMKMNRGLYDVP